MHNPQPGLCRTPIAQPHARFPDQIMKGVKPGLDPLQPRSGAGGGPAQGGGVQPGSGGVRPELTKIDSAHSCTQRTRNRSGPSPGAGFNRDPQKKKWRPVLLWGKTFPNWGCPSRVRWSKPGWSRAEWRSTRAKIG